VTQARNRTSTLAANPFAGSVSETKPVLLLTLSRTFIFIIQAAGCSCAFDPGVRTQEKTLEASPRQPASLVGTAGADLTLA